MSFLPNEDLTTPMARAVTAWALRSRPIRNMALHLTVVLSFVPAAIHAQVVVNAEFLQEFQKGGFTFQEKALEEYTTTPVIANPDMNYELAVRSKKLPLEIRYAIRGPSPGKPAIRVEDDARSTLEAVLLNISEPTDRRNVDSGILNYVEFKAKDVQNEFNAEWGASAMVIPRKGWARGFDRCMVVYIYRTKASAYMFYLFNDRGAKPAMEEIESVFYVLRFR